MNDLDAIPSILTEEQTVPNRMTFCFANNLHKWNSEKAFGLCCQPTNRTIRLTLTENFIWKSICTNLFLECSMLVTYVFLWKFRLFSWFLACLHSHSHRQNERIYGDSLIFKMKSYMAFVSEILVTLSIRFHKSHWNSHCSARQE